MNGQLKIKRKYRSAGPDWVPMATKMEPNLSQ